MAMYPPNHEAYEKHTPPPPQPAFQPGTATGIPVTTPNQYYNENQQGYHHHHHHHSVQQGQWSTGLCDCFDDVGNCCITFWCPCITFGQIAEIVDKGTTSCGVSGAIYALIGMITGCSCMYSCFYRSKLRNQYMLEERPCNDCLIHCCCESCTLCQEYRELKHRGFDMSIGWQGNVDKQNRGVAMAAPTAPVFDRGMSK